MMASMKYDCLIVGGGVTGTALLYTLAKFTDMKRLCLVEKFDRAAQGNSNAHHNSQTIHSGDIASNYPLSRAREIKRGADMVVNYATKLSTRERDHIIRRMPKMLLGVGEEECGYIRRRYQKLQHLYPRMQLLDKHAIADIEPNVALVDGSWRKDEIVATGTPDDYCAVDFQNLSESFTTACVRIDRRTDKQITQLFGTKVIEIRKDGGDYELETSRGLLQARSVVVCAGGASLDMAQLMGIGLEYTTLPLAGSFYFAPEALNGKVYRVQNPNLPFAAVHGDNDIKERGKTRFGPTALMLPMLKRGKKSAIGGLLSLLKDDTDVAATVRELLKASDSRNHLLRNFLYEVPTLNRHFFVREIRKIVPDLKARDIEYAEGFGGIRPLLIDKESRELKMTEPKITDGAGIVFNMTPPPGGTGCLSNAEHDMRILARHLDASIDEKAFEQELLRGYEDMPELAAAV